MPWKECHVMDERLRFAVPGCSERARKGQRRVSAHPVSQPRKGGLRDVLPDVLREHLVDERLVTDPPPACLPAERLEDAWIDADGD
jgi:hypothetical protein